MGKGLSPLQKTILRMARENAGRQSPQTDVTYAEVLVEYFGWPTPQGLWRPFSKKAVGEKEYRRGMASLSRAVARLEARGLVEKMHSMRAGGWSGVNITELGQQANG